MVSRRARGCRVVAPRVATAILIGASTPGALAEPTPTAGQAVEPALAFAGALGFGRHAQGGRGGREVLVRRLDDGDGEGTLRWAVEKLDGPRTIRFAVGGTIQLRTQCVLRSPYVTIDGSTAPGDGITVTGYQFVVSNTHDVVLRYLRFRSGVPGHLAHGPGGQRSLLIIGDHPMRPTHDVIVDHCSIGKSSDDDLSIWDACERITVQWCLIGDGEIQASKACLTGGEKPSASDTYLTLCYNLFTNTYQRIPQLSGPGRIDFYNNAIIHYIWGMRIQALAGQKSPRVNVIGNFFLRQRNYPWSDVPQPITSTPDQLTPQSVYLEGNFYEGWRTQRDEWNLTGDLRHKGLKPLPPEYRRDVRWPTDARPESALTAMARVLLDAGCRKPRLDLTDQVLLKNIENGIATIPLPPARGGRASSR